MRVKEVRDVRLHSIHKQPKTSVFTHNPTFTVRYIFSVIFIDGFSEERTLAVTIVAPDELEVFARMSDNEVKPRIKHHIFQHDEERISHDDIHMLLQR